MVNKPDEEVAPDWWNTIGFQCGDNQAGWRNYVEVEKKVNKPKVKLRRLTEEGIGHTLIRQSYLTDNDEQLTEEELEYFIAIAQAQREVDKEACEKAGIEVEIE